MERHHGAIDFETGPDGTTFRVLLPLCDPALLRGIPDEDSVIARAARPLRLLLVEDNLFVRNSVIAALRRRGHEVWEASDGPEGVARFRDAEEDFDAVLLDVVMPTMNGAEVAEEIRAMDPSVRILFMTGYDDDILRDVLVGEPRMGYIQKPFTLEALVERLARLVVEGG